MINLNPARNSFIILGAQLRDLSREVRTYSRALRAHTLAQYRCAHAKPRRINGRLSKLRRRTACS